MRQTYVNEFTSLRKASGVVAPAPKSANSETKEPKTRAIKGSTVPAPTAATPPIRSSSASVVLIKVKILCFRSVVVLVLRGSASTHQIALQSGTPPSLLSTLVGSLSEMICGLSEGYDSFGCWMGFVFSGIRSFDGEMVSDMAVLARSQAIPWVVNPSSLSTFCSFLLFIVGEQR